MSMKMMNAAYLVDNVALLSLQEKQDGVEFHCFDMDSKVQTTEGHIGWDVLDKQPSSTLEESARVVVLQKIPQLDGLAVAPVAPELSLIHIWMFPDGICRVTDNYYTKTIQFQDINYQLAQQEDQTAIFRCV